MRGFEAWQNQAARRPRRPRGPAPVPVTFSSADYPLFLIAVFAAYALTRADGWLGRGARVAILLLLGDLLYLLLTKDVATLWDPLGALTFHRIALDASIAPPWRLAIGAGVAAGAIWFGHRHGARLAGAVAQRWIAWGAMAAMAGIGVAVAITHRAGTLEAMSDGFEAVGHLVFLALWGVAIGGAQTAGGRPLARVIILLLASSVFYHAWAAAQHGWYRYLLLLLMAIVVGDYLLALAIERTEDPRRRKALLVVSLASNLGVLALFKYYDFFALDVLGLGVEPLHLILPAGISFHTFQSMSYTIDVYRREIPATRSVVQFATFVLFFPQLVAGPIVRAQQLLPQMERLPVLDRQLAADGLFRILVGLFKKIALADLLAQLVVDRVFEAPGRFSGLEVMLATYAYALQIYLDFSAYSDIAIGSAQLLGFEFPENFRTPYRSANLQEFWRRWHITLSSWLRDYLYIPLGGGRGGPLATYRNLTITMLLGGLWHGASWTFVTWGALHGLGLAATRACQRRAEAGASLARWLAVTAGIASSGALLHVTLVSSGDHGVLFHLIFAWLYTAPVWAAATAFLTLAPEPRAPAPPVRPGQAGRAATAPAIGRAGTAPPAPATAGTDAPDAVARAPRVAPRPTARPAKPVRKSDARKLARKQRKRRRKQGGAIRMPVAVALEPAATRHGRRRDVVEALRWLACALGALGVWAFLDAQAATLPLAVACAGAGLVADVLDRPPDDAFARRWAAWAARRAIAVVLTFHYVCLAWIFFRATSFDHAAAVLGQIATLTTDTHSLLPQVKLVLAVGLLAHFYAPRTYAWARAGFTRLPPWAQALIMVGAALALRRLAVTEAQPFIYFQF
jgi:D-alanyl-lipoteichoic acid acyltransferase DltB (MBOAT superfamily)